MFDMITNIVKLFFTILIAFGLSLLLIPSIGIIAGLANKHIAKPVLEKLAQPGPTYVDDPRPHR